MSWLSIDPTTLCVALLVLALCLLWGYVTIVRERREQPNLGLLLEPQRFTSQTGNKKTNKNRVKKKQGSESGNGKTSMQVTSETTTTTTTPAAIAVATSATSVKSQLQDPEKTSSGNKSKFKSIQEKIQDSSDSAEGEWQTQMSRPKLRAKRQRQRNNNTEKQGVPKSKTEELVSTAKIKHVAGSSSDVSSGKSHSSAKESSSSPDVCLAASLPVSDVETALREAGTEEDKATTCLDINAKKTRKHKRAGKRSSKQAQGKTDAVTATPKDACELGDVGGGSSLTGPTAGPTQRSDDATSGKESAGETERSDVTRLPGDDAGTLNDTHGTVEATTVGAVVGATPVDDITTSESDKAAEPADGRPGDNEGHESDAPKSPEIPDDYINIMEEEGDWVIIT